MTDKIWTPETVKHRLEEFIIGSGEKPSEEEIRELQHWFNEKSTPFLREAIREQKIRETKRKRGRIIPIIHS
jgi:hypothetical protein